MYEWIRNLFTAVDGGNDDEQGAAGNKETKISVADVAFFVWAWSTHCSSQEWGVETARTGKSLLDFIEDKVHELVIAFERSDDCSD